MAIDRKAGAAPRAIQDDHRAAARNSGSRQAPSSRGAPAQRLTAGGATGNEQLTALTGAVLFVLLAVLGITIIRIHPLLSVHMFLGMLLIGPVVLKMASTGYRFFRYYTGNPPYRRKGPPPAILRLIAPVVIASTVVVFASGVALLFIGPSSRGSLLIVHKASFIVWLAFTALHVLGHLYELPAALRGDHMRELQLDGSGDGLAGRILSLAGALVAGLVLAILSLPEFGPWLHAGNFFTSR